MKTCLFVNQDLNDHLCEFTSDLPYVDKLSALDSPRKLLAWLQIF